MADSFIASPRRVEWMLKCHPGEITSNICQPAMLDRFTIEELRRISDTINLELQKRGDHVDYIA